MIELNHKEKKKIKYVLIGIIIVIVITIIFRPFLFSSPLKVNYNLDINKYQIDKILDKNNTLLSMGDFNSNCIL